MIEITLAPAERIHFKPSPLWQPHLLFDREKLIYDAHSDRPIGRICRLTRDRRWYPMGKIAELFNAPGHRFTAGWTVKRAREAIERRLNDERYIGVEALRDQYRSDRAEDTQNGRNFKDKETI